MTEIATPDDVRRYWLDTLTPRDWYVAQDAVDDAIRTQFLATWDRLHAGGLLDWTETPEGMLAYLIVADQFSRNLFRGDGRAFATDAQALAAASQAIAARWDLEISEPARQFVYMPFMHAEDLDAQDRCISYFQDRMSESDSNNIEHAKAHRWVIAEFGRFPYRNAALGRVTTPQEQAFLDSGGYGFAVKKIQAEDT